MTDMDIKKDAEVLYDDIDSCIGSLVSGLMRNDEKKVDAAMQSAGTLMVRTMQFLRCLLDTSSDASNEGIQQTETQQVMEERKWKTGEELLSEHSRHCQEIHEDAVAYAKAFETHGESVPSHVMKAYEDGRLAELEYLSTKKNKL